MLEVSTSEVEIEAGSVCITECYATAMLVTELEHKIQSLDADLNRNKAFLKSTCVLLLTNS